MTDSRAACEPAVEVRAEPRGLSADVLGAMSLAGLGFAIAGLGACVALLARDLDESTDQLAVLPSAFAVGLLIVAAIGSVLLRTDAKIPVLRVGAIVCAVGAVLLAVAQNLVVALAGGLFVGLGGALMILVVPLMLSGPRAALRIARANAISSAIGIFAPLIIGSLGFVGAYGSMGDAAGGSTAGVACAARALLPSVMRVLRSRRTLLRGVRRICRWRRDGLPGGRGGVCSVVGRGWFWRWRSSSAS